MSKTTLCGICESRPARHTCSQCGTAVCDRHHDEGRDICAECLDSLTGVDDLSESEVPDREPDDDDLLR